jgi:hypothetical protein
VAGPRVRLLDLEQELLRDHSKRQRSRLVRWVGNDASRFAELMRLFLKGDFVIAQRAAWVVSGCVDQHHDLARPWLRKMLRRTQEDGVHDAVRRNVLGLLRYVDIPGPLLGEVATVCFDFLAAQGQPIAVRAFSMVILGNIAQREPGLKSELRLLIEQNLPYGSAAFAACARKVLKQMG